MKITKINGTPIKSLHSDLLQVAATTAWTARNTNRTQVTVGTYNAAKAVMDACNEELFKRALAAS